LCRVGLPGEGVIGGFLKGGEDTVTGVFERALDGFKVFAGELVGEPEEGLFLVEGALVGMDEAQRRGG